LNVASGKQASERAAVWAPPIALGRVLGQFEAVRQERLVIFCVDIDADLPRVNELLAPFFAELGLGGAELKRGRAPEGLVEAGWMAVQVKPSRAVLTLCEHLQPLAQRISAALGEKALCVFVDSAKGTAQAFLRGGRGQPRMSEGESFHVIRQVAAWLEADPHSLSRFFSTYAARNELVGPVDLTDVAASPEVAEGEDEEDRYVEAKLKAGREWMERYLLRRKSGL
jgi:hypothetical protein